MIFSKFNFRFTLGVYPRKPRNIGFVGIFCILASAVFLKTGISVSRSLPKLPAQRLTGANAELLPAMPASAAHGDAQRRSRPDKAAAGCAAPRPVPAAGWYGAAYRSDAKTRLRYPGSCCPFFVVLQGVPVLAAPADISVVSLGKGAVLWYNFISRSMETRGYAREIKP